MLLLNSKDIIVLCRDAEGNTPLVYAANGGLKDVVSHMIKQWPQLLHIQNKKGETAHQVVQKLIEDDEISTLLGKGMFAKSLLMLL